MFVEDLAPFFATAGFARDATLTVGGTPATVQVVFDAAYVAPLGAFEGASLMAWLTATQAGAVAQGDTLLVGATTYTVVEVKPDGTGVVELRLRS